jgi:hypothetical protein
MIGSDGVNDCEDVMVLIMVAMAVQYYNCVSFSPNLPCFKLLDD